MPGNLFSAALASSRIQVTSFALLLTMGRRCDVFDLPDLAGEANHVGVVADELHRGGLVQAFYDDDESTIRFEPQECAGVRQRRCPFKGTIPNALCEGKDVIPEAKFHVDE